MWLSLLEASSLFVYQHVSVKSAAWLGVATWSLSMPGLLLLAVALAMTAHTAWAQGLARGVLRHGPWPGLGLLALSAALHGVNVRVYFGLYVGAHMALSLATLACALLAWLALVPERAARLAARRVFLAGAVGAWLLLATASVARIAVEPGLRAHALEQATLLQHEMLALERLMPILTPRPDAQRVPIDPALRAALEPRPLTEPSGALRGTNVLLVTIDSMRADRLRAGGASRDMLPAMEALAEAGVAFTRAYAPSCWTVHSMSAVFFQRLPSQIRFTPVGVDANLDFHVFGQDSPMLQNSHNMKRTTPVPVGEQGPTLMDALRRAGYHTATIPAYIFYLRAAGLTSKFEYVDEEAFRTAIAVGNAIAPVPTVERAAKFLDSLDGAKPFFLWLHFMEPHEPYEARDAQARGQGREARYDSELRYVDTQIAALRAELTRRGLDERTLWVLHADHGEEFGDHGGGFHARTLYEETVRVPLLVRMPPGVPRGAPTIEAPVSLLDLAPTLLDALGVASSTPTMGRSLWPALSRGEPLASRPLLMECQRFTSDKRALLQWPFKLIVDRARGTVQLYVLEADPHERHNLADREPALLHLMLGGLSQAERILGLP